MSDATPASQDVASCDVAPHIVVSLLTPLDASVAWLCLVHVKAFGVLPGHVFDPSGNHPDVVVNKVRPVSHWMLHALRPF